MEKKLYIRPFIEVIKPFERVPLLSTGTDGLNISDDFIPDGQGGDAKGVVMEEMHDEFWGITEWD